MDARITDVIFDFCDVLLDWQPRIPLEGQYPPGVIDMFFDESDEYGFWHYDRLSDLGWSEERVLEDYNEHHGPAVTWVFRIYFERQRMALRAMQPGMAELLHDLDASGVRCWGLTNFTEKYVDAARELFPALGILRDTVVSSAEHIAKPDPAIYRLAIERFGVNPATTVFFDDKAANAEAATAVGLRGVRFESAAQARRALGL